MSVVLKLFGTPQIRFGKRWQALPFEKTSGLLLYVAAHGQGVARGELATLLWESDDSRARANLRQLLTRVRRSNWGAVLEVTDDHVFWRGSSDLELFWKALKNNLPLEDFAQEFLMNFLLSDAPAFMDWLDLERQTLRHAWRDAILQRAKSLEPSSALELLRLLLRTDVLCEEAVQAVLRLAVQMGQFELGRSAFAVFADSLKQELGLMPLPETILLDRQLETLLHQQLETLLHQQLETLFETKPSSVLEPRLALPTSSTPFIGREAELRALENLLESGARLMAVVAAGGMGKTRLVLRAAYDWYGSFEGGVVFASMLSLHGQAALADALLQGLAVLGRQADPVMQLTARLEDKTVLLVLDNLESDLEAATGLIVKVLAACAKVRILVTSRQRLGLSGETILELGALEQAAAENLFVAAARRADPRLTMNLAQQRIVGRIAEHCGCMPLALELAASWAAVLDLQDLEHEVLSGLQHLESRFRDTPERHRSIRAVFTQTWLRLELRLCQILELLVPLEGGFTLVMAKGIANATLRDLETLIARSLLGRNGQRYQVHELLRQFVIEQTSQFVIEQTSQFVIEQTSQKNFAAQTWIYQFVQELQRTRRSSSSLAQLEDELPNLRFVLWRYLELPDFEAVRVLALALDDVYDTRGLSLEAKQVFASVLQKIPKSNHLYPEFLKIEASYTMRLGETHEAERLFLQALEYRLEAGLKASVLHLLGQLYSRAGRWLEAKTAFSQSIDLYQTEAHPEVLRIAEGYNGLGINAKLSGDFLEAEQHLKKAIALNQQAGYLEGIAIATLNLANVHEAQGQDQAAKTAYEHCLTHFTELGHKRAISVVLNNLSVVQRKLGDPKGARHSLEQSLLFKREMHDKRGIAVALQSLAELELLEAQFALARAYLLESIQIALDASAMPTVMQSFYALAGALELEGNSERATLIWRAVAAHPATSGQIKQEILLKSLPSYGETLEFQELLSSILS
jgi:DNA-binding SARP family transcriptional activator/tetratricopeptide (TPR) repeat protein